MHRIPLLGLGLLITLLLIINANAQQPKLVLPIGHTGKVITAQFSPDGKKIVTTSEDRTAKIWDAASGTLLADLRGHNGFVNIAQFSPDGEKIVTASDDKTAKIWDVASATLIVDLIGHNDGVTIAQFSSDGKKILTSASDGTVKIWNAVSGILLSDLILEGYNYVVKSAQFSPDGKKIVTASSYDNAQVWNAVSGNLITELSGHTSWVSFAQFSPDGKKIVTTSMDSTAKIWDASTGKLIANLKGHNAWVTSGQFSLNGEKILTISEDKTAKIWDIKSGNLLADSKEYIKSLRLAQFSPNGRKIVMCSSEAAIATRICDAVSFAPLAYLKNEKLNYNANTIQFSPDGKTFATTGYPANCAMIWDAVSGALLTILKGHTVSMNSALFSPNGKKIITASSTTNIWDAVSGTPLVHLKENTFWGKTAQFSPDGKKIVTTSVDNTAKIWDAVSGKLLYVLKGHTSLVNTAQFSPDGKKIVTTSVDNTAKIWDAVSGALLFNLTGCRSVLFNPEGNKIVCYFWNSARIWDLTSGVKIADLNDSNLVSSARFSPDGNTIVTTASNTAKIWDAVSGKLLHILKGHTSLVNTAQFSSDGKKIVTASGDNTAKIWDAVSGALLVDLKGHKSKTSLSQSNSDGKKLVTTSDDESSKIASRLNSMLAIVNEYISGVKSAQFSPDGKKILTTGFDYTAKIWDAFSGALLADLKGHTNYLNTAQFSPDEKKVITASEDNTAKIWDAESGKLLYTLITIDTSDYLLQIKSGYYQCTANAAKLLHYVTPDLKIISFEQLDVKYNRPDKVLESIGSTDTGLIKSYRKAYEKRIKKLRIDTTAFQEGYSVPVFDFVNRDAISIEQKNENITLRVKGVDNNYKLDRFNVWINEVPIFGLKGINIRRRNSKHFDTTVVIVLSQGENKIESSIINVNGIESYRIPLSIKYIPLKPIPEKLHFIGIGINMFANSNYNLRWSVKDIRDLAISLKTKYGTSIIIDTLFDEKVTIDNIKALKSKLLQLDVNDKVILAYSGHGLLSKDYDYYLSTYTVNFEKPEQNGLPYEELENLMDNIKPRKKLMLVDACHSGEVDKEEGLRISQASTDDPNLTFSKGGKLSGSTPPPSGQLGMKNSFQLMQDLFNNVGRGTGTTVISAAAGTQFAYERGDLQNGVFTYSILDAFNQHKTLTISELKKIVSEQVSALTKGLQKPTFRKETQQNDWLIW